MDDLQLTSVDGVAKMLMANVPPPLTDLDVPDDELELPLLRDPAWLTVASQTATQSAVQAALHAAAEAVSAANKLANKNTSQQTQYTVPGEPATLAKLDTALGLQQSTENAGIPSPGSVAQLEHGFYQQSRVSAAYAVPPDPPASLLPTVLRPVDAAQSGVVTPCSISTMPGGPTGPTGPTDTVTRVAVAQVAPSSELDVKHCNGMGAQVHAPPTPAMAGPSGTPPLSNLSSAVQLPTAPAAVAGGVCGSGYNGYSGYSGYSDYGGAHALSPASSSVSSPSLPIRQLGSQQPPPPPHCNGAVATASTPSCKGSASAPRKRTAPREGETQGRPKSQQLQHPSTAPSAAALASTAAWPAAGEATTSSVLAFSVEANRLFSQCEALLQHLLSRGKTIPQATTLSPSSAEPAAAYLQLNDPRPAPTASMDMEESEDREGVGDQAAPSEGDRLQAAPASCCTSDVAVTASMASRAHQKLLLKQISKWQQSYTMVRPLAPSRPPSSPLLMTVTFPADLSHGR